MIQNFLINQTNSNTLTFLSSFSLSLFGSLYYFFWCYPKTNLKNKQKQKQNQSNKHECQIDNFSGLKLIKIERSPSPIIILPSLQSAHTNNIKKIKMSRHSMQSWQLNNSSNVHKKTLSQRVSHPTFKLAGVTRNPMAMASHRNKSAKSTGKSALMSHLTRSVPNFKTMKRESAAAAAAAAAAASSANQTIDMIYNGNDDKPWSCKMCKRQYKWKNSLNCHIKNECGKPPKFFCERMCGYKTNINSNMKRHMNSNCKPRFAQ